MNKLICLIALLVVANATLSSFPFRAGSFSQKRSIMAVMLQVEALMKANGPMDAITDCLNDFESEIQAEQIAHNQLHDRQSKECEEEFEFRTGEIEDAVAALKEGQETLQGCEAQMNRAKADLINARKNLNQNINQLTAANTCRSRESYTFATFVGKYKIITEGINEAKVFLDKLINGDAALVQLAKHTNKMIISAAQIGRAHFLTPVINILAQMASQQAEIEQALFQKLNDIFDGLKDKYDTEMDERQRAEAAAIESYIATKAKLEANIDRLNTQISDLTEEIDQLKKCITVQTNIISTSIQKRDRNQRLFDDASKLCTAEQVQYDYAKQSRADELDLLLAIRVKVEEHYKKISSGVTERGEQDEADFAEDDLSYEQKEFTPAQ